MSPAARRTARLAAAAAAALLAYGAATWLHPRRCLERRWDRLLASAGSHEWTEVRSLLADDYRDGWNLGPDDAIAVGRTAFQDFPRVGLARDGGSVRIDGRTAVAEARIVVRGSSSPFGRAFAAAAATIDVPTTFYWRRSSWTPWSWQLTSVANPALSAHVARARRDLPAP